MKSLSVFLQLYLLNLYEIIPENSDFFTSIKEHGYTTIPPLFSHGAYIKLLELWSYQELQQQQAQDADIN